LQRPGRAEALLEKKYDIISSGHITNDILNYRGKVARCTGGAVYYFSFAAHRSGAIIAVVAKLAARDFKILDGLKK
jgi:hypothetical protein